MLHPALCGTLVHIFLGRNSILSQLILNVPAGSDLHLKQVAFKTSWIKLKIGPKSAIYFCRVFKWEMVQIKQPSQTSETFNLIFIWTIFGAGNRTALQPANETLGVMNRTVDILVEPKRTLMRHVDQTRVLDRSLVETPVPAQGKTSLPGLPLAKRGRRITAVLPMAKEYTLQTESNDCGMYIILILAISAAFLIVFLFPFSWFMPILPAFLIIFIRVQFCARLKESLWCPLDRRWLNGVAE